MRKILNKIKEINPRKKAAFFLILSGILGAVFFFSLYSEILNPARVDWLLTEKGDPAQQYIGWSFFRDAQWSLPLGYYQEYGYPVGLTISYTDSVPIFAFIFKLFNSVLPENFQYFGIWILLCFILQGMFGFLLVKQVTKDNLLSFLGSAFFILSTVMLDRLGGHTALGSHWLLLWGMLLIIKEHNKLQRKSWTALFILAILIHPFLFILAGFLLLADLLCLLFVKKNLKVREAAKFLLFEAFIILILGWVIGLFYAGNSGNAGYGWYSMNLNSLFNPWGWSQILPDLPIGEFQYEGVNYLGLSIIILFILSIITYWRNKNDHNQSIKYLPICLVSFILTVLAISNVVLFNQHKATVYRIPDFLADNFFDVIRSSGRMFWPVYYFIILFSFYFLTKQKRNTAAVILIILIGLQIYEFSSKLNYFGRRYENRVWEEVLTSDFWRAAKEDYLHISFIPYFSACYEPIAYWAARENLTLNDGYFSRPAADNGARLQTEINSLKQNQLPADTFYIFLKQKSEYLQNVDLKKHLLTEINGYIILAPYFKTRHNGFDFKDLDWEDLKKIEQENKPAC